MPSVDKRGGRLADNAHQVVPANPAVVRRDTEQSRVREAESHHRRASIGAHINTVTFEQVHLLWSLSVVLRVKLPLQFNLV